MRRFLVVLIIVCTLAAGGLLGWWRVGTYRANELVGEANLEIEAINTSSAEAQARFAMLSNDFNKQQFPRNRTRWEPVAREAAALYEKSAVHARAASGKFDEAARRPTKEVVVAYNRALSAQFAKKAERFELLKEYVLLWVDPTLQSTEDLTTKQTEITHRLAPIQAAEQTSVAEADRIAQANPHQFD